jgi:TonB family protein
MATSKFLLFLLLALISFSHATAQVSEDKAECVGPVYKSKEVTRRVKILSYPAPDRPSDSRVDKVKGPVILDVVACKDGRIVDIAVVQDQPYGLTEAAIKAARRVKFRPAEKDNQAVSQKMRFEYEFRL